MWNCKEFGTAPKISSYIANGKRRLFYVYGEKLEMIEEYDMKSHEIQMRRWRMKGELGEKDEWEIGEPNAAPKDAEMMIASNTNNPVFLRRDNLTEFQFRVRNLTYPIDVYSVTVDEEKDQLVVRTTNKKYFKRFAIPDLQRLKIALNQKSLSFIHANNTLVITYEKPQGILFKEKTLRDKFKQFNTKNPSEGDFEGTI